MIYKGLKFANGNLVAAGIDFPYSNQELMTREFLELHEPIEFIPFKFADPQSGQIIETISMAPFIPVAGQSSIVVRMADVLTITNLHETAERRYLQYLEQLRANAIIGSDEAAEIFGGDDDDLDDDYSDLFDEDDSDNETKTLH